MIVESSVYAQGLTILRRLLKLGFVLLILASIGAPSTFKHAASNPPLILFINGDMWAWKNTTLTQLTHYGYNDQPILSPDGTRVAYTSTPQDMVDVIKVGGGISGSQPANIWILNIADNSAMRIAEQPVNVSYTGNPKRIWIERSTPTWSPDGKQIAWIEHGINISAATASINRLMVYTLSTKQTTVLLGTIPIPQSAGSLVDPFWGSGGVAFINVLESNRAEGTVKLQVIARNGKPVVDVDSKDNIGTLHWIKYKNVDYLTYRLQTSDPKTNVITSRWRLFDPVAGTFSDMPGFPEVFAVSNAATISTNADSQWMLNHKRIIPGGEDSLEWRASIAIAPDGSQIAYIDSDDGSAYILAGDEAIKVADDVQSIVWAPLNWRVMVP